MEAIEEPAAKLARLEHLLTRNSANSSLSPSKDDDPGRTPPAAKPKRRGGGPKRKRDKQPGAGREPALGRQPDQPARPIPDLLSTA